MTIKEKIIKLTNPDKADLSLINMMDDNMLNKYYNHIIKIQKKEEEEIREILTPKY